MDEEDVLIRFLFAGIHLFLAAWGHYGEGKLQFNVNINVVNV